MAARGVSQQDSLALGEQSLSIFCLVVREKSEKVNQKLRFAIISQFCQFQFSES